MPNVLKKLFLVAAAFFGTFVCSAQQNSSKVFSAQLTDSTSHKQVEQENYQTKQYFLSSYIPEHHKTYKAKIEINKRGGFIFGSDTILVDNKERVFKALLAKGLIYPDFFIDFTVWGQKKILLGDLEELTFANQSPTVRRLKFYEWGHMLNTTVYLIELTNKKGDSNTSLLNFVKGAEVTFITEGWVEI